MEPPKIYEELNRRLDEPRLGKLYRAVRSAFNDKNPIAHNWEHVRRDILNAVEIGLEEGADMDIVLPAIILHDLGDGRNVGRMRLAKRFSYSPVYHLRWA